ASSPLSATCRRKSSSDCRSGDRPVCVPKLASCRVDSSRAQFSIALTRARPCHKHLRISWESLAPPPHRRKLVRFPGPGGTHSNSPSPPPSSWSQALAWLKAWPPRRDRRLALARRLLVSFDAALLTRRKHVVDEAVFLGLRRSHVEVAVDVFVDEVLGLARGRREDVGDHLFEVADLASLDLDVGRLTAGAAERLMDHDPRVGERRPPALDAGRQQHRG